MDAEECITACLSTLKIGSHSPTAFFMTIESITVDPFQSEHVYANENGRTEPDQHYRQIIQASPNPKIDWTGLASFLRYGMFLGDRTHLDGIHLLRGGHTYSFQGGRPTQVSRSWSWDREIPEEPLDFDRSVDKFAALFHSSVASCLQYQSVLPLSGGLDSRCLLAALGHADPSFELRSFSYGYASDSIENKIAVSVAAKAGLKHDSLVIGQYMPSKIDRAQELLEGFQDLFQARQLGIEEYLSQFDWVLGGHWGDVWLDAPHDCPTDDHIGWILEHWSTPGAKDLVSLFDPALGDLWGNAENLLADQWSRTVPDEKHFTRRYKIFKTEQWSARWTLASIRAYQGATQVKLPFYDIDLALWALDQPDDYLRGRRLQIEYLKRYAPGLARVEWQEAGTDLFSLDKKWTHVYPKRAWRKARRALTGRPAIQRNWEVQLAGKQGDEMIQRWLLEPSLFLRSVCIPNKLDDYVRRFKSQRDRETGSGVCKLITLSHWFESYGIG